MVAGYHLHLHACPVTGLDGLQGLLARRVDHALKAEEEKAVIHVFVGDLVDVFRYSFSSEGKYPQARRSHVSGQPVYLLGVQGSRGAIRSELVGAPGDYLLNSALDVGHVHEDRPVGLFDGVQRRHVLMLRLERHGV